jgi:indolepyruvate ferredoxin oxidoreductase beta subunit
MNLPATRLPDRPVTILIAALGGEGGGVLTDWIVSAAQACGFPVQSTSIPGVAQRTGATTYYVEILPVQASALGGKRPLLALTPGIGDIDIVLASELMEAGRTVANGFVTPDRTLMIASLSRFYVMNEKIALGDGRYDQGRLIQALQTHAQRTLLFDMEALAKDAGAMINAVMLGAIAGSGRLPIPAEALEAAIGAGGKAVANNLRGLRIGHDTAQRDTVDITGREAKKHAPPAQDLAGMEREIESWPESARQILTEGVRRLAKYQDLGYARLYLDRLTPIRSADRDGGNAPLLAETARHLAVRMSYEDVIRVAEAKIAPARMRRIAQELRAKPDEPFLVTEFLKPGVEEMCDLLPPSLARRVLAYAEKRGWRGTLYFGMEVTTTSLNGYLRFWALAKLRRWRRGTSRYHNEQQQIESWLGLIVEAARLSPALAAEIAECARLIKGYGDTHKRGTDNYAAIEARVIRPVLAGRIPVEAGIDAIASARMAALVDPEGESLARCLADIERQVALPIAAE